MADGAGVTLTLGHAGKNADYALGTDMLCGPTRMNPESKWDGEVTSWGTGPQDWNAESARSLEWSTVGNQRTQLDELEGFFSGIHNSSHPKHIQSFQTTFDSTLSSSCLPNCEENNRRVTSGAAFEQNFGSFPEFQDTMQSESYSSPAILLFDNGDLAQDYASANQNSQHISSSNQSTGAHKAIDFDMFLAEPQESSFPSRGFASFSNGALGITSSSMLISPSTISMNAGPFKNSTNRGKTRNTIKRTSKAPRSSSINPPSTFSCNYSNCRRTYSRLAELNRHQRIHSGLGVKLCTVQGCLRAQPGRGFVRSDHLIQHLRGVHGI